MNESGLTFSPPKLLHGPHSIAAVSFLNTKPLIEPLVELMEAGTSDLQLHLAVPSQLLGLVDARVAAAGLLSIVDYQKAASDLLLLPVGMIGCDGPTLTVRIFSRVRPEKITTLHGDTDSHTSVILAQIILRKRYSAQPTLVDYHPTPNSQSPTPDSRFPIPDSRSPTPETLLLIGDKVVNAAPTQADYPYQLDLGEEWKLLTGLPFVFACWMLRADTPPPAAQELAQLLDWSRRRGALMTDKLVEKYAAAKHWPGDLARRYFTQYLRYQVTDRAREGIARFFALAAELDVMKTGREIRYFQSPG